MTVSSCPSCREPVVVPAGAPGSARVRCPLCRDEFLLSVVLDKLPPTLELLDAPAAESSALPAGAISVGPVVGIRAPAFEFDEASAPTTPRKVTPSARPKRKEKSIVLEMVKIVLGGAAGILLALVILWWGFNRDPFNLAPKVAAYASWAVPPKLRPAVKETPPEQPNGPKGNSGTSSANGNRNGAAKVAANDGRTANTGGSKKQPLQGDILGDPPFGGSSSKKTDDDPLKLDPLPGIGTTPKETRPQETRPKVVEPKSTTPQEKPKPRRFDLAKTIKKRTSLDLAGAVTKLQQTNDDVEPALLGAVEGLTNEKRIELMEAYHNAVARLGEVVISVDPNDLQIQNEFKKLAPLLHDIAESTEKQKLLALLGERWLANSGRPHAGLCVVGVVKNIGPSGRLYEIDVELLTKSKTVVKVLAGDDPAHFYQAGDRVMLLGAIVPDPKKNLTGYEGEETEVPCVHFYVPLKEPPPAPVNQPATEKPASEKPAEKPAPAKPSDEEAK